ncbi:MAG: S-adenosylmethionine:tRNA ribosyltransferase-isomerase [Bacteroidales bacterium]|nr:S-adenosylmethionine:tRNA ribosyltransferase-isomerase [Bacteroidales bacterium]
MIKEVQNITIEDYNYPLPDERIAKYPLSERDASKLLVLKDNKIQSSYFKNIGDFLPEDSLLIFNETKVVRARLQFTKESGASIEIFCLEPITGNGDYQLAFSSNSPSEWKCLVGNSRRWKNDKLSLDVNVRQQDNKTTRQQATLYAERVEKNDNYSVVRFSWEPSHLSFAEILEAAGEIPLPPYLHREAEASDRERYQTVFAKYEGSVAAPTAGLHFTNELIQNLKDNGISFEEVTLHVGAGTFRPVSSETIGEHEMHSETIAVKKSCIENLIKNCNKTIIPVGTTSMRTLESIYWIGLMLMEEGLEERRLHLNQWFPYKERESLPSAEESLSTIVKYLEKHNMSELHASTALMIAPSCNIKVAKALITNFHQPKSTLLLLVSALIGERWKDVYQYALDNDFRFLSYGDSCFFTMHNS